MSCHHWASSVYLGQLSVSILHWNLTFLKLFKNIKYNVAKSTSHCWAVWKKRSTTTDLSLQNPIPESAPHACQTRQVFVLISFHSRNPTWRKHSTSERRNALSFWQWLLSGGQRVLWPSSKFFMETQCFFFFIRQPMIKLLFLGQETSCQNRSGNTICEY